MFKNNIVLLYNGYCYHTTCKLYANPGKVWRKVTGESKKKKYYVNQEPILPSASAVGTSSFEEKIIGNPKRSNVLNKVFMRHVTDLMATGEYAKDILGYGIEVNKVKVSADYKFLRVYWIAQATENLDKVEDLLKKNAGHLRHELSTLRVMGQVPNIVFVKDKNYCKASDILERLKKADFGEDYEQLDTAEKLKSEFEILTSLDNQVKERVHKIELESKKKQLVDDLSEIPPMPQNVLGLNHSDILKRVKKGMSMSKAEHRSTDTVEWVKWSEFKSTQPVNEDPVTFGSHSEQRKAFQNFLLQRQIMKQRLHRLDKRWTEERDILEEETHARRELELQRMDSEREIDEDYIIEDVEDTKDYTHEIH